MSTFEYRVKPLPAVWPGKATPMYQRKRPQFKTIWSRALDLLEREIHMLSGKNVEIAVDVDERHLRNDGQLRADARPRTPAVIVSFDARKERLAFPCDTFTFWQENVDAIARALEALRMVDRYGVQTGKQYTGFKAIPASTEATFTTQAAAEFIQGLTSVNVFEIMRVRDSAKSALRIAAAKAHPDSGGSSDQFNRVQLAKRVLEAHHGGAF